MFLQEAARVAPNVARRRESVWLVVHFDLGRVYTMNRADLYTMNPGKDTQLAWYKVHNGTEQTVPSSLVSPRENKYAYLSPLSEFLVGSERYAR